MVKLDFGGVKEDVITRKEFTIEQAQKILKNEVIVSLGYGIQGRAQSLNMRDNGVKVIIGQENTGVHKAYYDLAVQDGWVPPKNVDVILVAPKGLGTSVRRNFLDGSGINSSFAVYQNYTGKAKDRTKAMGIAIGSGYLFPTTFENEVFSDLTGERGVLMGALAGIMEAQYNTLRKNGH